MILSLNIDIDIVKEMLSSGSSRESHCCPINLVTPFMNVTKDLMNSDSMSDTDIVVVVVVVVVVVIVVIVR